LLTVCIVIAIPIFSSGQVKVNSSGYVGIGNSSPSYNLDIFGSFRLNTGGTNSIYSTSYNGMTVLLPSADNTCFLGYQPCQFYMIFGKYIYQNRSLVSSDKRMKENLRDIDSPLNKVLNMKGKKYDFKTLSDSVSTDEGATSNSEKQKKDRLGFLAQDLQLVLPEAVVLRQGVMTPITSITMPLPLFWLKP
jgi:hypothetical protein